MVMQATTSDSGLGIGREVQTRLDVLRVALDSGAHVEALEVSTLIRDILESARTNTPEGDLERAENWAARERAIFHLIDGFRSDRHALEQFKALAGAGSIESFTGLRAGVTHADQILREYLEAGRRAELWLRSLEQSEPMPLPGMALPAIQREITPPAH